jgi:hypothetical protein
MHDKSFDQTKVKTYFCLEVRLLEMTGKAGSFSDIKN